LSLANGVAGPTAGFSRLDAAFPVSVSSGPQPALGDTFLVNSVASGGTNYSLAVRAAPGRC
jgi:3-oxoacyl-(acyl-carrier-protein) synthase